MIPAAMASVLTSVRVNRTPAAPWHLEPNMLRWLPRANTDMKRCIHRLAWHIRFCEPIWRRRMCNRRKARSRISNPPDGSRGGRQSESFCCYGTEDYGCAAFRCDGGIPLMRAAVKERTVQTHE